MGKWLLWLLPHGSILDLSPHAAAEVAPHFGGGLLWQQQKSQTAVLHSTPHSHFQQTALGGGGVKQDV